MSHANKDPLKYTALSSVLHSSSISRTGGVLAMSKKDPKAHKAIVNEYFKHWEPTVDSLEAQKDRYHDLVTDIYEHIYGTRFHFCRIRPGIPLSVAVLWHEHFLADQLDTLEGQRVVDIGCGVGGPAREIAKFANIKVVGVNCNEYQLQRAVRYTTAAGQLGQVTFHKADFMQTGLEDESFDAAYSIEGTSYAPTLEGVYAEIFRVLRPGGTFAAYELILTDNYNDDDVEHRGIRDAIEKGIGLTNISTISQAIKAMETVGFEVQKAVDLAGHLNEIPWYYPIVGSLKYMNSVWDANRLIHMALLRSGAARHIVGACETLGFLPPGSQEITDSLAKAGDILVKAGEKKLFTPLFLIAGKKPLV